METAIIGVVCSIIGVLTTLWTINRNKTEDVKRDTKEDAVLSTKLDYISRGVDDIRLDIKAQDKRIADIGNRLIRVEESTKSAHHRIDELTEKKLER